MIVGDNNQTYPWTLACSSHISTNKILFTSLQVPNVSHPLQLLNELMGSDPNATIAKVRPSCLSPHSPALLFSPSPQKSNEGQD